MKHDGHSHRHNTATHTHTSPLRPGTEVAPSALPLNIASSFIGDGTVK